MKPVSVLNLFNVVVVCCRDIGGGWRPNGEKLDPIDGAALLQGGRGGEACYSIGNCINLLNILQLYLIFGKFECFRVHFLFAVKSVKVCMDMEASVVEVGAVKLAVCFTFILYFLSIAMFKKNVSIQVVVEDIRVVIQISDRMVKVAHRLSAQHEVSADEVEMS